MSYSSNLSFVRKNPITTAVVTIALAAGVAFTLTAPSNNNVIIRETKTADGRQTMYETGSGARVQSGALTVKKLTTTSGAKITNAPASQGVVCGQTGGLLRYCRAAAVVVNGILTCECR